MINYIVIYISKQTVDKVSKCQCFCGSL